MGPNRRANVDLENAGRQLSSISNEIELQPLWRFRSIRGHPTCSPVWAWLRSQAFRRRIPELPGSAPPHCRPFLSLCLCSRNPVR